MSSHWNREDDGPPTGSPWPTVIIVFILALCAFCSYTHIFFGGRG